MNIWEYIIMLYCLLRTPYKEKIECNIIVLLLLSGSVQFFFCVYKRKRMTFLLVYRYRNHKAKHEISYLSISQIFPYRVFDWRRIHIESGASVPGGEGGSYSDEECLCCYPFWLILFYEHRRFLFSSRVFIAAPAGDEVSSDWSV